LSILKDLAEKRKVRVTQKKSRRQKRVAEIEESWKLYTCFSTDKKKETGLLFTVQRLK